jgi:hypothetical protein
VLGVRANVQLRVTMTRNVVRQSHKRLSTADFYLGISISLCIILEHNKNCQCVSLCSDFLMTV